MASTTRHDLLFGKIALNKGFLTKENLNEALLYQRHQAPNRPLGDILLERGFLSQPQVTLILRIQGQIAAARAASSPGSSEAFGGSAIAPGGSSIQPAAPAPSTRPPSGRVATAAAYPNPYDPGGGYPSSQYPSYAPPQPTPAAQAYASGGFPAPAHAPYASAAAIEAAPQTPPQWPGAATAQFPSPAAPGAPSPSPAQASSGRHPVSPTSDPGEENAEALIGTTLGGCQIQTLIGAGGMGAIYRAHHAALSKEVVVKVLPKKLAENPRTVERFVREARAAARLEHPNIVGVHNVGNENGVYYIIMQYVDGENLNDLIKSRGKYDPTEAARIILQVAKGLAVAHRAGIIHRDIKAENILITRDNEVRIADFGLAKDLGSDVKLTAEGQIIGTPLYMAPEIGRVTDIDGRVDLYSLGVTFYYLVTGVQPFAGFNTLDVLSGRAHERIRPPDEIAPGLLPEVADIITRLMAKDREDRYATAEELIAELEAVMGPPGSASGSGSGSGRSPTGSHKTGRVSSRSRRLRRSSKRVSFSGKKPAKGAGNKILGLPSGVVIALAAVMFVAAIGGAVWVLVR